MHASPEPPKGRGYKAAASSYWQGSSGLLECQTACKPGSVPRRSGAMAIHLGRPLPDASRDLPGRRRGNPPGRCRPAAPTRSCSRWGLPCRPRRRRRGALLPHPFTLTHLRCPNTRLSELRWAVCSLWHSPWGRPRRALPGTVVPWSPDFPPPRQSAKAAIRPSGGSHVGCGEAKGQVGPREND